MDIVKDSNTWRDTHQHLIVLSVFRIILGLLILYKGIYFVSHWQELQTILSRSVSVFGLWSMLLAHAIALFHLTGGLFIILGFLTRLSIVLQIPWVLGAVLFVNSPKTVFFVYSEWLLSLVILIGLCFFLFYGPGFYSLDVLLKRKRFYE